MRGAGEDGKELVKRLDRAPSWSWASVDGRVAYPHIFVAGSAFPGAHIQNPELDLQISEFRISEKHTGSFGELKRAEVDVGGEMGCREVTGVSTAFRDTTRLADELVIGIAMTGAETFA